MKSIPKRTLTFIDSWLTLRSRWARWPGFTVAIAKDGEVVSRRLTLKNFYRHGRNAATRARQVTHR